LNITSDNVNFFYASDDKKTISGDIMKLEYLQNFSTKFFEALKRLNKLVWGKKGPKLAFIYSNLVKVGIELFQQVLLQNGYLEYQENTSYHISSSTICYFCGHTFEAHKTMIFTKDNTDTHVM